MKKAIERDCHYCDGVGEYEVTVEQPATEATGGMSSTEVIQPCEHCQGHGRCGCVVCSPEAGVGEG